MTFGTCSRWTSIRAGTLAPPRKAPDLCRLTGKVACDASPAQLDYLQEAEDFLAFVRSFAFFSASGFALPSPCGTTTDCRVSS